VSERKGEERGREKLNRERKKGRGKSERERKE